MSQFSGAFPAPTWTPPAREPFVPLRPLTLGQILSGAIRALRSNTAVAMGPAILVSVAATVSATLLSWLVVDPAVDAVGSSSATPVVYRWLFDYGAGLISWILLQSAVLTAGIWQQGVAASLVAHAVVGRRLTTGGLRRRTRGTWARQTAWAAIVFTALVVGGLCTVAIIGATTSAGGGVGGWLIGAGLHAVCFVALAWVGTRLAVVPSVITIERETVRGAVRRSWRLTGRSFWRTFGTRVLAWTMIWLATMLITVPFALLTQLLTGVLAGNGDMGDALTIEGIASAVLVIASAAIGAIGLVITTSTDALVYLDLRMRQEGLDLELARFIEVRRPGTRHDPAEPDPFRAPATPAAAPQESPW